MRGPEESDVEFVGVAGVDKPRIVQIGVSAEHLAACK